MTTPARPVATFAFETVPYVDDLRADAPQTVLDAARQGFKRKLLARGEGGFFSHYTEFPPGFLVAPHSHDHDELIVIVAGEMTLDDGQVYGPLDSVVLLAGHEYGFTTGPQGLRFFNIRRGDASITFHRGD